MKARTTLLIDKETIERAQSLGLNISQTCENSLKVIMNFMQNGYSRIPEFLSPGSFPSGKESGVAGGVGFEPTTTNLGGCEQTAKGICKTYAENGGSIDWTGFLEWLEKDHRHRVSLDKVSYCKRFAHCLLDRDLSEIRDLRESLRPNVLKALSSLAKYLGIYEEYRKLMAQSGLKWAGRSSDDLIIDRLTKVEDAGEVWAWIREVKRTRPELQEFMDLMALTGLRLGEAISSYNLIIELSRKGKLNEYYKPDLGTLEHYKFKDIFIRKSKKAFFSFVPEELIQKIQANPPTTQDSITKSFQRRHIPMRFSDIRENHGTFLIKHLKETEIDFLHGRATSSVFMKNYFNPALIGDLKDRAQKGLREIQERIQ